MANQMVSIDVEDGNDDVNLHFSVFKSANFPITLKFVNVVYTVKLKEPKASIFRTKNKTVERSIIKGVTGIVKPGDILAVLGPSGCGKTSLLTALGGRIAERKGKLTGNISYNNKPFSTSVKRTTGFVTQDDALYPHLTVTETLVYTALLRLPNSMKQQHKIKQAEAVVTELGLERCKNTIIGGPLLRGVSGGERKRVSIGQEILINPSLLFLDEPTSGLDSTTAQKIVSVFWKLARSGRTVVTTIHQPSSRLFYMFDKILLLSDGSPIYFGTGSNAMDYFASIGYSPSVERINPSDFLLDIANGVGSDESQRPEALKATLVAAYKTNLLDNVVNQVKDQSDLCNQSIEDPSRKSTNRFGDWPTTWCQQFFVLLKRGLKERKHDSFSGLKVGRILFVSFLCGLLWWQTRISRLQDQIGLLFFISSFWGVFSMLQQIYTFPQERKMLEKERSSGMYRLSSYFMSRVVGDLPMELILPTMFLIITYCMAGLKPANFFLTLLILLVHVLVSSGLGLAVGALVMDEKSATTLGSIIMLTFSLPGGYYVHHVPIFISWIKYISIAHYTYKLMILGQYNENELYPCGDNGNMKCRVGDFEGIKQIGFNNGLVSALALVLMLIGYRVIAYIGLMRIDKTKSGRY